MHIFVWVMPPLSSGRTAAHHVSGGAGPHLKRDGTRQRLQCIAKRAGAQEQPGPDLWRCMWPQAKANEKKYTGVSSDESRFGSFGGRGSGASGSGLGGLGGNGGGGGWGGGGGRYDDDDEELESDKVRGLHPPRMRPAGSLLVHDTGSTCHNSTARARYQPGCRARWCG